VPGVTGWDRYAVNENDQVRLFVDLRQPAITQACRVLRDELLPHFYATKIRFRFWTMNGFIMSGQNIWLKQIGRENRRSLENVELLALPSSLETDVGRFSRELGCDFEVVDPEVDTYDHGDMEHACQGEMVYRMIFT